MTTAIIRIIINDQRSINRNKARDRNSLDIRGKKKKKKKKKKKEKNNKNKKIYHDCSYHDSHDLTIETTEAFILRNSRDNLERLLKLNKFKRLNRL